MNPRVLVAVAVVLACGAPGAAAQTVDRYALVVGANSGGPDRPRLLYAVTDAERFARVMGELGGVSEPNEILLRDPKVGDLLGALDGLKARLVAARSSGAPGSRTEVFVYYSGHADESGLLLGEDRLSYRTLRDRLDGLPADVRIAVLDACASGAFTRPKGGKRRPPFVVDASAAMRGYAFLTSSSASESAQESDRIRASYFTHYLVSGFRGAADSSGDGRVTLNEAYQFAFAETLGRTVDTRGGAQHPTYEINLSGAGDVVITDVRRTTARLVIEEPLEGRVFVRTAARALVAELYKPAGREVEIALEPGAYDVRVERDTTAQSGRATVGDGTRAMFRAAQLSPAPAEPTRRRGGDVASFALVGTHRFVMQSGLWGTNGDIVRLAGTGLDITGGAQYGYYVREDLALTAAMTIYGAAGQVDIIGGTALPLGVQWNPRGAGGASSRLKPFLAAGIVPITAADSKDIGSRRRYSVGANIGAGLDVHLAPGFALGASAGFNAMPAFTRPKGRNDTFHGLELAVRMSWILGSTRD
jgi:Caspase domain